MLFGIDFPKAISSIDISNTTKTITSPAIIQT